MYTCLPVRWCVKHHNGGTSSKTAHVRHVLLLPPLCLQCRGRSVKHGIRSTRATTRRSTEMSTKKRPSGSSFPAREMLIKDDSSLPLKNVEGQAGRPKGQRKRKRRRSNGVQLFVRVQHPHVGVCCKAVGVGRRFRSEQRSGQLFGGSGLVARSRLRLHGAPSVQRY